MTITKRHFIALVSVLLFTQISSCAIHKAYQKNPKQVGEIVPCSARVAKKLTALIYKPQSPKRIIEVGAGSGAITPQILAKMNEDDHLDLIEIEPILCDVLKEKFGHLKNVSVQCMDFLQWQPNYQYDYVISTLPLNSFAKDLVQRMVDHLVTLSKDGADLSFVELKWLSGFRMMAMNNEEKKTFLEKRKVIEDFYIKYSLYDTDVYMNFPPILIHHLKIDKSKAA